MILVGQSNEVEVTGCQHISTKKRLLRATAYALWIQAVQRNLFVAELKFLSSNKVLTRPAHVAQSNSFLLM